MRASDNSSTKKLTDWGRQMLLQLVRWLPERRIIAVTDASFAAIQLLNALRWRLCMITRLRLDARPFDPPPRRRPGTIGRPRADSAVHSLRAV